MTTIIDEMASDPERYERARQRLKNKLIKGLDIVRLMKLARKKPEDMTSEERLFHEYAMSFDGSSLPFKSFSAWEREQQNG